ncbi:PREDICTED: zinc finger MYM-type protein 1-like [Priapulus caudatus]|uniref:Zinc finger MYM-type protein 1-like n=1 Tax=Priapulus caudatus TaxID=37621 RepID=A0ABM1F105_PRICU|nr:PREDICTED: zinc finger MYM-type protein 1-like [Priapulus caudatus]
MGGPFVASVRSATGPQGEGHSGTVNRFCTKSFLERTLSNGEIVSRSWLCYSLSTCHVYCFACKLSNSTGNLATVGYGDWKHARSNLEQHERSTSHCWNVTQLAKRASASCRIDETMIRHANEVESYWCQVSKRCVSVISFLAERVLAFRGTDEIVSSRNNGNYLGLMELLAQYDSFLAQHIQQHANKGTGHTNYLFSTTCEELIAIMETHVLDNIVGRVKEAKYFSVTVDSTPDASPVDQLTCVLRYMKNETPVEPFVHFFDNAGHTGQDQANSLMRFIEANGIDIANCRGQSYDNAANMSGKYRRMQAIIQQINPLAVYVPCTAHSLNLVGQAAVSSCRPVVSYFGFVQELYNFFTSSTSRFDISMDRINPKGLRVPKSLSDTRWSAHAGATKPLREGYTEILDVLDGISEDENQKGDRRNTASSLYGVMNKIETGFYTVFWDSILDRFNRTSKSLQGNNTDLNTAVALLKSLSTFVHGLRDRFEDFVVEGAIRAGCNDFSRKSR